MDDLLLALVSCGGLAAETDVREAAGAWAAARGRAFDGSPGADVEVIPHERTVLLATVRDDVAPDDPAAFAASLVFFDQAAGASRFDGVRGEVFAAARRTYDTRAVRWRPRPPNARKGAPPYLPPQRDPLARLGLVASLLDRSDAEATAWVAGLVPRTRQEWADADRASVVAALPALADLLPDGVAPLVAQALAGDERHGFGWTELASLRADHPGVFPEDVWDDVRKRFARWAKRRQTYR